MDYRITHTEAKELLSTAFEVGFQRCLETLGKKPKYISQNKAYERFTRSRVQNWVKDGDLTAKPNGNGKTSTKFYELVRLLELDASSKIIIRKSYPSPNSPTVPKDTKVSKVPKSYKQNSDEPEH